MNPETAGRSAANEFRREHRLGNQPLGDLVALIEQITGHDVAVLDVGTGEHGLTMRDPERDVTFIGVARTPHYMRQRSTLAHELAHVIFEDWNQDGDLSARSPEEQRADAFARHLLVPQTGLTDFLGHRDAPLTESNLSDVVQHFLVSPAMAAIALETGQLIDARTKSAWMQLSTPQLASRFGWLDQYTSLQDTSNRTRAPQRLVARAQRGYEHGVVSLQVIATLRGLSADDAAAELERVGIIPEQPSEPAIPSDGLPDVSVDLSDLDDGSEDALE